MIASSPRVLPIDAARGMAMFFSCIAHFAWWLEPAYPYASGLLSEVGKVATPTFLLLSGAMTGWLCASPTRDPVATRYKILNRGLFLITFGHFLVSVAEAHRDGGIWRTMQGASIVDEIGLSMLISAMLYRSLRAPQNRRLAFAAGLSAFAACWVLVLFWHPESAALIFWRQVFIGPDPLGTVVPGYSSPTIQYVAIFAMGLAAGDRLQRVREQPDYHRILGRFLLGVGGGLAAGAVLLRLARLVADHAFNQVPGAWLDLTWSVTQKTPPSPAYLAFYAGCGLMFASSFFLAWGTRRNPLQAVSSVLAVVGRASLFVFVLQYFVYWTVPDLLGIAPGPRAPWLFIVDLLVIWAAAWGWGRIRGNRFLTVGLGPARRQAQAGR